MIVLMIFGVSSLDILFDIVVIFHDNILMKFSDIKQKMYRNSMNTYCWTLFAIFWILWYVEYNSIPRFDKKTEQIDAFDPNTLKQKIKEVWSKDLVLCIYSKDFDWEHHPRFIQDHLSSISNIKYFMVKVDNVSEFCNAMRDYSIIKPISSCIILAHWNSWSMSFNNFDKLRDIEVDQNLDSYSQCFDDNATMLLYSCSAASWDYNIAKQLSETLEIETQWPTNTIDWTPLMSQKYFNKNHVSTQLSNVFIKNKNNKLEFNGEKFCTVKDLSLTKWTEKSNVELWVLNLTHDMNWWIITSKEIFNDWWIKDSTWKITLSLQWVLLDDKSIKTYKNRK